MTWTPKYTITKEILSYLTKIESIKNSFEDKPLSPVLLSSLHQSAKISSTHYSTKIEGNHLSLKQVENALYTVNKSAQSYQGHDEKEVNAYYDALNYMEKHLEENAPFSESFIQKLFHIGTHKMRFMTVRTALLFICHRKPKMYRL